MLLEFSTCTRTELLRSSKCWPLNAAVLARNLLTFHKELNNRRQLSANRHQHSWIRWYLIR